MFLLYFCNQAKAMTDGASYDDNIETIITSFQQDYMDEDEAEKLFNDVEQIIEDIEYDLNHKSSSSERLELQTQLNKAKDVFNSLAIVSGSTTTCKDINSFYRGAKLMGLSTGIIENYKFSISVMCIRFKELVCYALVSSKEESNRYCCKYVASDGSFGGQASGPVHENSIVSLCDNRDAPLVQDVIITRLDILPEGKLNCDE